MCGIVGIYLKNHDLEPRLGEFVADMLEEMGDRGPDSAGVALYRSPAPENGSKVSVFSTDPGESWNRRKEEISSHFEHEFKLSVHASHAILASGVAVDLVEPWIREHWSDLQVMSIGKSIEIYKEKGHPKEVIERFGFRDFAGTHAIAHTRMATESAVTTEHSHPFSTGLDLCLVHNGSLSNHNRLRQYLIRQGGRFETDNDSEVAAGFLTWRLSQGDSVVDALHAAIDGLDGFYTFAIGSQNGFSVLRDPIACKPAVLAENDDWVAMSSEYRAIAKLPDAKHSNIWEPSPAQIYSWGRD
ncbi:MAG: glutamine amidotransferase family protein [Acidiferrobacterales bacterium]|nr:glutamine amidotransferase family protein [Acidiferrobacterales bacterium]